MRMKRLLGLALALSMVTAVGCSKPSATYDRAAYKEPPKAAPEYSAVAPGLANPGPGPAYAPPGDTVTVTADAVIKRLKNGQPTLIIEIATEQEYAQGHPPNSLLTSLDKLADTVGKFSKDQALWLISVDPAPSAQAYTVLKNMGYTNLHYVVGGMLAWRAAQGPEIK